MSRHRPERAGEAGSTAIELVASIPLLVIVTIFVIEGLLAVSGVNIATRAARDGARAAAAGGLGVAAAQAQIPAWMQTQSIRVGPGVVPGCQGICSRVQVGVPIGLPGFLAVTHLTVVRTADFPRG